MYAKGCWISFLKVDFGTKFYGGIPVIVTCLEAIFFISVVFLQLGFIILGDCILSFLPIFAHHGGVWRNIPEIYLEKWLKGNKECFAVLFYL